MMVNISNQGFQKTNQDMTVSHSGEATARQDNKEEQTLTNDLFNRLAVLNY